MLLRFFITLGLIFGSFAQDAVPTDPTTPTTTTTTTTTSETTTTTTTPTTTITTTVAPTTEAPETYSHYNITNKDTGVVCIMLDGNLKFKVEYNIANKTNIAEIELPKPTSEVTVLGSCNDKQFINISWGAPTAGADHSSSVQYTFTESKDGQTWTVGSVFSIFYISAENFPNATDTGSKLTSNITVEMKPAEVPVNKSYKCYSNAEFNNFTTTIDGSPYNHSVSLHVSGVQLQAYNKLQTKDKFTEEIHCDADKVADIVPIAVGCALAGLIIIVLIAYIVGRRRRSASYQSV